MCFHLLFIRMIFKRKGVKSVNLLRSTELQNGKLDWGLPKHFAIEIHVATFQVKVFYPVCRPLFAEMIFDTPRLAGTQTGAINHHVGFKKRPEEIVGDFAVLEKGGEACGCGCICLLHEVDQ